MLRIAATFVRVAPLNRNAMYRGELLDFFGCRKDLRSGIVKVLHPMSFVDDPTRILRAVKFEQEELFRQIASTEADIRSLYDTLSAELHARVEALRIDKVSAEALAEHLQELAMKLKGVQVLQELHKAARHTSRE